MTSSGKAWRRGRERDAGDDDETSRAEVTLGHSGRRCLTNHPHLRLGSDTP